MPRSNDDLETVLGRAYRDQTARYAQALAIASSLPDAFLSGTDAEEALRKLAAHLDAAAEIEQQTDQARRQWQALGRRPGPALQAALDGTRSVIEEFLEQIQRVEQSAAQAKARLIPELDAGSRRQRMRTAYTAASRHG